MLNFKTLKAVRAANLVSHNSEGVTRKEWCSMKAKSLIGNIAFLQAGGGHFYSHECDFDKKSLQARYMKGMRPGGVFS